MTDIAPLVKRPMIKTKLPGPRAQEIVARDQKCMSPAFTRAYPAVLDKGEGAWLTDVDGNILLDFNAGIAVTATGHCHPEVVAAIQRQAAQLIHMSGTDFYYEIEVQLAEKLCAIVPTGADNRVFLCNSGTEAIEGSLKLARYATKRQGIIGFIGAFHGRSMGSLSVTASKTTQRKGFHPLVPGVYHAPYANCYRCVYNQDPVKCGLDCVRYIEEQILQSLIDPEEVAAIMVEPIQGEGGYVVAPPKFLQGLRALATKYGILLIVDEIQSGMGRTGKMFAIEHSGVKPDIVAIGKGIASGVPLGAFVAGSHIMTWPPGAHGTTFGGNPLACAAALTTIDLLQTQLIANAAEVGGFILDQLRAMQQRHELIGDVRGIGLMVGVELVKDRQTKEPAREERDAVVQKCFEKGVLILGAGKSSLRLCPPLIVNRQEAMVALEIIDQALGEVQQGRKK
ncbi:MAG: acetyl ornithine aminotransferase family protein [Anaerolineae bacterium]